MRTLSLPYDLLRLNQLDTFTEINLEDLVSSVGWVEGSRGARLLRRLFHRPARVFARQMVEFDADIGGLGLTEASRRLLRRYVRGLRVHGRERLPEGPLLLLANHPGMTDTISLFTAIARPDLRVIALQRPFLSAMPNMDRLLHHVHEDPARRMGMVRKVSAHLRARGALLTFPAGRIEPDPALSPAAALASLEGWTDSVGVFARMAPETSIVPVVVRGVVWKAAGQSPLLRLKRSEAGRERLAAALQLLGMVVFGLRPVTVQVQIGEPVRPSAAERQDPASIHRAVLEGMRRLLESPPEGAGGTSL